MNSANWDAVAIYATAAPLLVAAILLEGAYYRYVLRRPYGWHVTGSNLAVALGRLAAYLRSKGATVDEGARPALDFDEVSRDTTLLIRGATCGKLPATEFETSWRVRNERPESDDSHEIGRAHV